MEGRCIFVGTASALSHVELFDRARSISLHASSMEKFSESARVSSGEEFDRFPEREADLLEVGADLELRARHFGQQWRMRSRVTEMRRPFYFCDEQVSGPFKYWLHEHFFLSCPASSALLSVVRYSIPFWPFSAPIDSTLVNRRVREILVRRVSAIANSPVRSIVVSC